jgi:hypothetical protein
MRFCSDTALIVASDTIAAVVKIKNLKVALDLNVHYIFEDPSTLITGINFLVSADTIQYLICNQNGIEICTEDEP